MASNAAICFLRGCFPKTMSCITLPAYMMNRKAPYWGNLDEINRLALYHVCDMSSNIKSNVITPIWEEVVYRGLAHTLSQIRAAVKLLVFAQLCNFLPNFGCKSFLWPSLWVLPTFLHTFRNQWKIVTNHRRHPRPVWWTCLSSAVLSLPNWIAETLLLPSYWTLVNLNKNKCKSTASTIFDNGVVDNGVPGMNGRDVIWNYILRYQLGFHNHHRKKDNCNATINSYRPNLMEDNSTLDSELDGTFTKSFHNYAMWVGAKAFALDQLPHDVETESVKVVQKYVHTFIWPLLGFSRLATHRRTICGAIGGHMAHNVWQDYPPIAIVYLLTHPGNVPKLLNDYGWNTIVPSCLLNWYLIRQTTDWISHKVYKLVDRLSNGDDHPEPKTTTTANATTSATTMTEQV